MNTSPYSYLFLLIFSHHWLYICLTALLIMSDLILKSFGKLWFRSFICIHVERTDYKIIKLFLKRVSLPLICFNMVVDSYLYGQSSTLYNWVRIWISYSDYSSSSFIYNSRTCSAKPRGKTGLSDMLLASSISC